MPVANVSIGLTCFGSLWELLTEGGCKIHQQSYKSYSLVLALAVCPEQLLFQSLFLLFAAPVVIR